MGLEAPPDARRAGDQPVNAPAAQAVERVVGTFVDALARAGVHHVCACPGSRSTPLAIKLAQHPRIKLWMHLDERSAAYFGLGLARAAREPVGLLATSGTAAANFFPAIVEANLARVPLVVLTADRPHELRDNGAAQTIDQLRLYGNHVRWFFDLPEPEPNADQLRLVSTLAARAVSTALAEPAGPVHLNWPFREPLVPTSDGRDYVAQPQLNVTNARLAPPTELVADLTRDLAQAPRGIIVAGPADDPDLPRALERLAARLGYPILADPLSGSRCGPFDHLLVIDAYDALLRSSADIQRHRPELVLRFGALPTSKPLQQFIQSLTDARVIVVDPGGWRDPGNLATDMLHVDPVLLCYALADAIREGVSDDWATTWVRLNNAARRAIERHLQTVDELFEGKVFAELAQHLPDGALLYAGNSMPVRDLDTFLPRSSSSLRCLANRGANGIDGVVSSALGASAAGQSPVVLVIGDISFYHDLNGLLAARKYALDLLVVLLNNDGGGIFSFLPQADAVAEHFEQLFGTPHGLDFRPFVQGYGGHFVRVDDWSGFNAAVGSGLERGGLQVVEVPTDRTHNVAQHRAVWRAVTDALSPAAVC
jgi:2-succinyl-5-enolpyruvyl-6-hydroxy-3-cyclohexene-1-carboxylate synthase